MSKKLRPEGAATECSSVQDEGIVEMEMARSIASSQLEARYVMIIG